MRNFLLLFLLLMPVIGSCTDDYDDSAAWKDIDGIYKDLDQLKVICIFIITGYKLQ